MRVFRSIHNLLCPLILYIYQIYIMHFLIYKRSYMTEITNSYLEFYYYLQLFLKIEI